MRPAGSSVIGARAACCARVWMSRNRRSSGPAAYTKSTACTALLTAFVMARRNRARCRGLGSSPARTLRHTSPTASQAKARAEPTSASARATCACTMPRSRSGVADRTVVAIALAGVLLQGVLVQHTATGVDDSSLLVLHRTWNVVAFMGPPLPVAIVGLIIGARALGDGVFPRWLGWIAIVSAL